MTGAASNLPATTLLGSVAIGGAAGFANGVGTQIVSAQGDHSPGRSIVSDALWAGLDGALGAGENAAGTRMNNAIGPNENTMGSALSGVIGMGPSAFCGVADQSTHNNWNC